MKPLKWRISYIEADHAQEELISDHFRTAYKVLIAGWFALIIVLFAVEYTGNQDPMEFARNAIMASILVAAFYGALVGMRTFAHRRPDTWHMLNWAVIWLFLIGVIAYYFLNGVLDMAVVAFLVLVCVYAYRWLMHRAVYTFEVTDKGVSEHVSFFGHKQTFHTPWKEVRSHRVHPLTGSVELKLKGHYWHFKPHCHLIVPAQRQKRKIHTALAKILWRRKRRR
jgi:hypothetical protein